MCLRVLLDNRVQCDKRRLDLEDLSRMYSTDPNQQVPQLQLRLQ